MKVKIIKKILAYLIFAVTMIGTISSSVNANPKKYLCHHQNIYDLNECGESDEEQSLQKVEEQKEQDAYENEMAQFVSLLKKSVWHDWDAVEFLEICLDFSRDDLLGECPLKQKLKITDRLTRCLRTDDDKRCVAAILLNFSNFDFFKEYPLDQKLDITYALIECASQNAAKEDVVEALANLSCDDFFKEYSVKQKLEIVKTLIECLSEKEFDRDVVEPLKQLLGAPEILKKLDQSDKSRCLDIIKRL